VHCRAELFGEAIVCSDTDVEENCLPVADTDFLFLDSIPQVRRGRFYFLFTLATQFWGLYCFSLHAKFMYLLQGPLGLVSVSNLSSL